MKKWIKRGKIHLRGRCLHEKQNSSFISRCKSAFLDLDWIGTPYSHSSHVLRLQKMATNHIRKWLKMAKTATSELIYSESGWNLTSMSKLWLQCTAIALTQMEKSRDPAVQHALRQRIQNEQKKRSSGQIRPLTQLYEVRDDPAALQRTIQHPT